MRSRVALGQLKPLEKAFTSHAAVGLLKRFSELPLTVGYRRAHKLRIARTWPALRRLDVPLVLPIPPRAFTPPADWQSRRIFQTPFLYLRTSHDAVSSPERLDAATRSFVDANRLAGRKLILMTFSSMPVRSGRPNLDCGHD